MRTCAMIVLLTLLSLIAYGCEVQKSGHTLTQSPPDAEHLADFLQLANLTFPTSVQPIKYVEEQTDKTKTIWLSIKINPKEFALLNGPNSPFKGLGFRTDELPPDDDVIKDFYCLTHDLPEKLNVVSTGFDGKRSLTMFHVEGANPEETWFVYFRVKNK